MSTTFISLHETAEVKLTKAHQLKNTGAWVRKLIITDKTGNDTEVTMFADADDGDVLRIFRTVDDE